MVDFPLLIWKDGITLWHPKMAMDNPPFSLWKPQFMYISLYLYLYLISISNIYIYIYIQDGAPQLCLLVYNLDEY